MQNPQNMPNQQPGMMGPGGGMPNTAAGQGEAHPQSALIDSNGQAYLPPSPIPLDSDKYYLFVSDFGKFQEQMSSGNLPQGFNRLPGNPVNGVGGAQQQTEQPNSGEPYAISQQSGQNGPPRVGLMGPVGGMSNPEYQQPGPPVAGLSLPVSNQQGAVPEQGQQQGQQSPLRLECKIVNPAQ
jgi:hypothetical protein